MTEFEHLLHGKIEYLYLKVWPPHFEQSRAEIDISLGLVLVQFPERLDVITTGDDAWTPCLQSGPLPRHIFSEREYERRMRSWMAGYEMSDFDYEYYDFSQSEYFKEMIAHPIGSVEMLSIHGIQECFGVRLVFNSDFILSLSAVNGNTVESARFNCNRQLDVFKKLGTIVAHPLGHTIPEN